MNEKRFFLHFLLLLLITSTNTTVFLLISCCSIALSTLRLSLRLFQNVMSGTLKAMREWGKKEKNRIVLTHANDDFFTVQFQAVHNKRELNLLPLQCAVIDYTFKCKLHVFHISVPSFFFSLSHSITRGQWKVFFSLPFVVMNSGFNLIYLSITLRAFLCCLQRDRGKRQ